MTDEGRTIDIPGISKVTGTVERKLGSIFRWMEEHFWLNLQTHYDLEVAKIAAGDRLKAEVEPHAA